MRKLLTKIYLYRIFSELILLYPLYNVMFVERGDLNTFQVSTLLGIWAGMILLFEIPSGAMADKYTRRSLLGWAQAVRAIGYAVWVFVPNYWGFLIGLALWGIARAITSGTFEALLFDELKAEGKESQYARVLGRSESLALFFSLGSTLLAAPVFLWLGYEGVLWFSVVATVIASLIAFTLPIRKRQEEVESSSYTSIIRKAINEVKRSSMLFRLICFGIFVGMLFRIFDEYASLIIKSGGIETGLIPIVSTLVFVPVIVADFLAYKAEHLKQISFMILLIAAGLGLTLAGYELNWLGLIFFSLFMLLIKLSITVFNAKIQHAMKGEVRATVTSLNNFGVEAAAVIGFFTYGLISQLAGVSGALMSFGVLTVSLGVGYLLVTKGKLFVGKYASE
jgi:MFS family permease